MSNKLKAGNKFSQISVKDLSGKNITIGNMQQDTDWQMVIIYRGVHCPLCTKYLNKLEHYRQRLFDNGVDLIAISEDNKDQLLSHLDKLEIKFPICYGLTL